MERGVGEVVVPPTFPMMGHWKLTGVCFGAQGCVAVFDDPCKNEAYAAVPTRLGDSAVAVAGGQSCCFHWLREHCDGSIRSLYGDN